MKNGKMFIKQFGMTLSAALLSVTVLPCQVQATPEGGNGWEIVDGKWYWYEDGIRQGYDENDSSYRGKEIYDPSSDAWYWLDNVQQGAKAVSKDVYQESAAGDWAEKEDGTGKWVRYDAEGHMIKGWAVNEKGAYYFDPVYGTMAKGSKTIDGEECIFNQDTGILEYGTSGVENGWAVIDGKEYWYENGIRQGYDPNDPAYRGKEIYDPGSDGWYWLDNVQKGAKAVSKDVYQESAAGDWAEKEDGTGKWVRYDEFGIMIKGWSTDGNGTYYFDPVYGTMAKGNVMIDGIAYHFDEKTGIGSMENPEVPGTIEPENPDEPGTETPDEPGTETPDEPGTETPDEPGTETPDEPGTETPDEPKPQIPENPDDIKGVPVNERPAMKWESESFHVAKGDVYQFDSDGKLVECREEFTKYISKYQYDEKGYLTLKMRSADEEDGGVRWWYHLYEYDKKGNLIKDTTYATGWRDSSLISPTFEGGNKVRCIVYGYDNDNNLVWTCEYSYYKEQEEWHKHQPDEYEYKDGHLVKITGSSLGVGITTVMEYGDNGKLIKKFVYYNDKIDDVKEYDANGNVVRHTHGRCVDEYKYDANGNLIKATELINGMERSVYTREYNADGKLQSSSYSYEGVMRSRDEYEYREDGTFMVTGYYYETGGTVVHEEPKEYKTVQISCNDMFQEILMNDNQTLRTFNRKGDNILILTYL